MPYKSHSLKLKRAAKNAGEFGYLFENLFRLCKVMELKYDLGVRTRKAYLDNDREELQNIANNVYPELIKRLKAFTAGFRKLWLKENKPFGIELHELRLGGLLLRLESCREILLSYLNGEIDKIDELDAPVLPFIQGIEKTANICYQAHINTVMVASINSSL